MNVTIERGVPIPPRRHGKRGAGVLTKMLAKMKKGDSAFFPNRDSQSLWFAGRLVFGSGNFTVRKVDGGARIWRL